MLISDSGNHCVQVFSHDGTFLRRWGSEGTETGQFQTPWHVSMRGDEVLVSDDVRHTVLVFRLDGTFLYEWELETRGPTGMAVMPGGRVLVCHDDRVSVLE